VEEAPLLAVDGLRLEAGAARRVVVGGATFTIAPGEAVALVGESGSGKSLTAQALLGLQPDGVHIVGGSVRWRGEELVGLGERALRRFRGGRVAYVFQDPYAALNPVLRVGTQVDEVLRVHRPDLDRAGRRREVEALFTAVELPDPARLARRHPHELSGGQRQRVLIAAALAGQPELLVADEPTTALDVTVQRQVVALLERIRAERGLAMLWISHDLQMVRGLCDRVLVMHQGEVVEEGPPERLFREPRHAHTRALVAASTRGGAAAETSEEGGAGALLEVRDLHVRYPGARARDGVVHAVRGVSLRVEAGETLALVGESGSGKSSIGRAVLRLESHAQGTVRLDVGGQAVDWLGLAEREARPMRRHLAMVFQDPASALDPRMRAWEAVAEPLAVHGIARGAALRARSVALLEEVGLGEEYADRLPRQLSGGQCQRVGIARAVALDPRLVVCDEAVSALDATVQERILGLLRRLQQERGLAYLFITHDLSTVRALAHRVAVLRDGELVETGTVAEVLGAPRHPYTAALVEAARALHSAS